jgi:hypothetical protein
MIAHYFCTTNNSRYDLLDDANKRAHSSINTLHGWGHKKKYSAL